MNAARFNSLLRVQTSQARKVFDAVPMLEPWSVSTIMAELQRCHGTTGDHRVVAGCLRSLVQTGLINEPRPGMFIRTAVKPARVKEDIEDSEMVKSVNIVNIPTAVISAEKPVEIGPIERLSVLADRLRNLATDMEAAALELAEREEKNEQDTAKMRQLQALLKSLG